MRAGNVNNGFTVLEIFSILSSISRILATPDVGLSEAWAADFEFEPPDSGRRVNKEF
jgi:hypothetical protein